MKSQGHIHTYDADGKMTCCLLEEKIESKTSVSLINKDGHFEGDGHDHHNHTHNHYGDLDWKSYLPSIISLVLLLLGLVLEHILLVSSFSGPFKVMWYGLAYLPVGIPVMKEAIEALRIGEIFTEFFLMTIATIGAFAIGEYPEGVAVMLFYSIGELFQTAAVKKAKNNIKALLDVRPKLANVYRNSQYKTVSPENVMIGETIQVKVGEKVPLDGILITNKAALNNAALTGESRPQSIQSGSDVMAGSINLEGVIELKVRKLYNDSSIARILELVQNATSRKSKTELLIRRLAKIYTPIVVYLAIAICFVPYLFVAEYSFSDWLYRALIFLVISCPCALVISIPLGYFGGLGAASQNGILFKGATYLDQLTRVNTLVFDKTGTMTKGVFEIKDIVVKGKLSKNEFMGYLMALESKSTHPIAKAIMNYEREGSLPNVIDIKELAGKGIQGEINGKHIIAGNSQLMELYNIAIPKATETIVESIVMVAIDDSFTGYITIADELKKDAKESIRKIKEVGVQNMTMLSGDKNSITQEVANELGLTYAKGDLLPEDKLHEVKVLSEDKNRVIAFVGDGINDAPVLAAADVGIAMGGLGSDIAIETADVIIQTDQPSKIATGIRIGNATQRIIWQNIAMAFGVKAVVLILGAVGLATMWEAVFADVGVALLAILNAVRLQRMKWG